MAITLLRARIRCVSKKKVASSHNYCAHVAAPQTVLALKGLLLIPGFTEVSDDDDDDDDDDGDDDVSRKYEIFAKTMLASPARTPNRDDPYGAPLLRGTSPGGSEPQGGANFTPFSIGANLTPFFTASACSHKGEEEQETT
jgi:hypothetical protein